MRILFIAPYTPNLIRVRSYNFIRGLVRRGHRVVVACPWVGPKDRAALESLKAEGCEVLSARADTWKSLLNCAGGIFRDSPLQAVYSWQPRLMQLVERALSQNEFDVVHVEHLRAAVYGLRAMSYVRLGHAYRGSRPVIVWDSVDCISTLFREARQKSSNPMKRWILGFEQPRTEAFEAKLLHRFNRVIVTTENDARSLENLAASREAAAPSSPEVVCNGVDLQQPPGPAPKRLPATVVMTGKMSYHANVTAAKHLVEDIMPLVWRERPEVRVEIVGQRPTREVLALARSSRSGRLAGEAARVLVTGEVPDVRPYLQRATLAIAPILYGTGVQNKVLEAMAASAPVVATPLATAALTLQDGREVLIGHSPGEMASHIRRLLEDPELRARLGRAGRHFVETHHNWDRAVGQLEAIYRRPRKPQAVASEPIAAVEA
jgi:polysaccharide biosynthesis protein PslH